jgi:hypothetical protein
VNKRQQTAVIILLLLAWVILVSCCRGATVTFTWTNWDGTISTNDLVVRMIVQPLNDGTYTYKGLPNRFATTNGHATRSMAGALYDVVPYYSPGLTNIEPVVFAVPVNDTNTYDFWKLSHSGGRSFNFSPGVQAIYAGNNITIVATNGVSENSGDIVISSTGGGSGVSVAATAPVSAVTNSSLVTLALSFMPMLASANLTNFSGLTTNFFYPSNNPAGFIPSNAIPGLYGYVTNAVTTNSSTGVTNVVTSVIGQTPITGLSNVRSGTPANGFVLTYQNGTWTNQPAQGTNTYIAAGANVTVTTNGSANLYTIAAASNANSLTNNETRLANFATGVETGGGVVVLRSDGTAVMNGLLTVGSISLGGENILLNTDGSAHFSGAVDGLSFAGDGSGLTGLTIPHIVNFTNSVLAVAGSNYVPADSGAATNLTQYKLLTVRGLSSTHGEIKVYNVNADAFIDLDGAGGSGTPKITTPALNVSGLTASTLLGLGPSKDAVSISTSFGIASSISDETGSGALVFGTAPTISGGTFSGNGGGLTNLTATNLSGAIPQASIPTNAILYSGVGGSVQVRRSSTDAPILMVDNDTSNVYLRGSNSALYGDGTFAFAAGSITGNVSGIVAPAFTGSAAGLTNANASTLFSSGTIQNNRLAGAQPRFNAVLITNTTMALTVGSANLNPTNLVTFTNDLYGSWLQFSTNGNLSISGSFVGGGLAQTNISAAAVTNAGDLIWSNHTAFVLSSSGNATNLTAKSGFTADGITATNLKSSALTAQRILVSDNGSPPSVTNMAAGGANTVLHGTTPPALSAVVEGDLSFTDVVTANASATTHGLLPKLANDTSKFLRSDGTYQVPTGAQTPWTTDVDANAHRLTNLVTVAAQSGASLGLYSPIEMQSNHRGMMLSSVNIIDPIVASGQASIVLGGQAASGSLTAGNNFMGTGFSQAILGGLDNTITGDGTSGLTSPVNAYENVIVGGGHNRIYNIAGDSIVVGGQSNYVTGNLALAAGFRAKANHQGSFVWSDSQNSDFSSAAINSFNARAVGGFHFASDGTTSLYSSNRFQVDATTTQPALGIRTNGDLFLGAALNVTSNTVAGNWMQVKSNLLATWPTAPTASGACAIVNSNGFPYMLLSTNGGGGGSATWTGTNKLGW